MHRSALVAGFGVALLMTVACGSSSDTDGGGSSSGGAKGGSGGSGTGGKAGNGGASPDGGGGATGGSAGTPSGGAGGAAGSTTGGAAGTATGGTGALAGGCTQGSPCNTPDGHGLCPAGKCVKCNDPADDPKCKNVYGAGFLCIDGGCKKANCRGPADCGGKACIDNHCAPPCNDDSDCADPAKVCNKSTGVCVTNASCGNAGGGAVCPVNPQDKCCGAPGSAVCKAVECCGPSDCAAGTTCSSGICVPTVCGTPPVDKRYVDPSATKKGNGSQACPLQTINGGMMSLGASGGTVIVRGGTNVSTTVGRTIPTNVHVIGGTSAATFDACTEATCPNDTAWPTVTVTATDVNGFDFTNDGPASLRFFRVVGPGPSSSGSGVLAVTNGANPVSISHLRVSKFAYGIASGVSSRLTINEDVHSFANDQGLSCGLASFTHIGLAQGAKPTLFNNNNEYGISVGRSANFSLDGPSPPIIKANFNKDSGLIFGSDDAAPDHINGFIAENNMYGLYLYAGSSLTVRNSSFTNNVALGIGISASGTSDASSIDLGTNATTGAGKNSIKDNGFGQLCISSDVTDILVSNGTKLQAAGNQWSSADCTQSGGTVSVGFSCTKGVDVGDACSGTVNYSACKAASSSCQ